MGSLWEEVYIAEPEDQLDVVTGAFSYSGKALAEALVKCGRSVRTLTGHPERAPTDTSIDVRPLDFRDPSYLRDSMHGAHTLYNTYWVRFAHRHTNHATAVENSRTLFRAAQRAGIRRIVHISITNPSLDSPYEYFRGKAEVERALSQVEVPYSIVRPAILFGGPGVLLNNIAWLLRHLPVFAIGDDGSYRVRPVHIDDLARICIEQGARRDDRVIDAVGPERPTFLELVTLIRDATGSRARLVRVPGPVVTGASRLLGVLLRDVLLTSDEYYAMAQGLADTDGPATGRISVSSWIKENAPVLGTRYANELRLHFR